MRRRILWLSIGDRDDARFVQQSFDELLDIVGRSVSEVQLEIRMLRARSRPDLLRLIDAGDIRAAARIVRNGRRDGGFGLFVYCAATHPAARAARGQHKLAVWGLNLHGALSITYGRDNKYILWHEALHLLGVDDHYDEKTLRTTCGLPTCLMQYAPCEGTIGNRRLLCGDVTAALAKNGRR